MIISQPSFPNRKETAVRNHLRKVIAGGLAAIALAATMSFATVSPAQAVETRPGASFGQYDVMLTPYETEQVRRSLWAATVTCLNSGLPAWATSWGLCQSLVTVCAAQAYYANPRMRAGMTLTLWGYGWCWKY